MSEELKPCPFCGEKAKLSRHIEGGGIRSRVFTHFVSCVNKECPVFVKTQRYVNKKNAVFVWNNRAVLA